MMAILAKLFDAAPAPVSIYEKILGDEFHQLHPRIQERFGFSSSDGIASVGSGEMDFIWYNKLAYVPLALGASRHIMFPQGGKRVPFSIENFAYRDRYGRETVTWIRKFKFNNKVRRFDATMIYSEQRKRIVDYLGDKQHLAVDLTLSVTDKGGIRIRSGDQRFYEGLLGFQFPRMLTGNADVEEWYDDAAECYRISVHVKSPLIGTVFCYRGRFTAERRQARLMPADVRPLREERRE
ncbi:DUF4166 domain-containing protein [Paenibacillus radicis (ex Gao et al. 2016)]|uniref:DUF4166 domain-containing protein n=1 Tax=Paenibacillus radicis (ex Gao et al. 2016) TaxID=1737354 RepID=A0A917H8T1_9BACL|nr:DUF4166 domain-containing protein [Paenibacillus radicis (ex Gao et al. 2016)]GGG70994.1 hypothetical protein GCM10010918_28080 [Paenibacillus radicis (ex Gao et al. 2016)]